MHPFRCIECFTMSLYHLHSIYLATEGEGIFLGTPQVFVRFQGCAVGCLNCDSLETWDFERGKCLSLREVLREIGEKGNDGQIKRVSLTGGDPLHPKHERAVEELLASLKERGYWVNLEAAGTRLVDSIFDGLDFISFDFKTPSTGVATRSENLLRLVDQYAGKFQIKSVVETDEDFQKAHEVYSELKRVRPQVHIPWCLTPSYPFGEDFPRSRFQRVIELNHQAGGPFRVIGQQHKWIFSSTARLV